MEEGFRGTGAVSALDIVCYYAECGRPYAALLERMTASAKRVMPECRTVLLTPTPNCDGPQYFDLVVDMPMVKKADENGVAPLSLERCRANVSWLTSTDRPTICCDPDVEFINRPVIREEVDIGLVWRDRPDQHVTAALFYSKPGQRYFWQRYGQIVFAMPKEIRSWWADQMAFQLMVGAYNRPNSSLYCDGSLVWFYEPRHSCALPDEADHGVWAIHYKGSRKGAGWDKWFETPSPQPLDSHSAM